MIKRDHGSGANLGAPVFTPETLTGNSPRVSVVLLNKDEPELATSLDLLRSQCVALDAECIVIDALAAVATISAKNGPGSGGFHLRPRSGAQVHSAPAQRRCACRCSAVVAFCDAGEQPAENWLEKLTAPLLTVATTSSAVPSSH